MDNIISKFKNFILDFLVLKNIFKTSHKSNVLICYTILPYLRKKCYHSNAQEVKIIASVFSSLGFNVDLVHYTCKKNIDYSRYSLIFGFGNIFEKSFFNNLSIYRIFYATGADCSFQNLAEIKRIKFLNRQRYNFKNKLLPKRLVHENWSLSYSLSDLFILIGNDWTKSTYKK